MSWTVPARMTVPRTVRVGGWTFRELRNPPIAWARCCRS